MNGSERRKKYHFVGIGGMGMSALAQVLCAAGCEVTGSEKIHSKTTAILKKLGVHVFLGHDAGHVRGADCVIWSSAIASDNPEILQAREDAIPLMHRAELLAQQTAKMRSVAVAGMHGKTTVTGMIFHVLVAAGMDPTFISGGMDAVAGSNAVAGTSDVAVFEADESDGSLAGFYPHSAVLTNLEEEHMGFYRDLGHIRQVFAEFVSHVRPPGCAVYCSDDKNLRALTKEIQAPFVSYGCNDKADYFAGKTEWIGNTGRFEVWERGIFLGTIQLSVPGSHNVSNALAAVALGRTWGIEFDAIRQGLERFRGAKRRLELKAEIMGVRVIDDYAHHPTEIEASLKALAQNKKGKLVVVFQPHRYSRVSHLAEDFARAFGLADEVIVAPIFSAGESNPLGLTSEWLAEKIRRAGHPAVRTAVGFYDIAVELAGWLHAEDIVVGMGAGDIEQFPVLMKEALLGKDVTEPVEWTEAEALKC